MLFYQKRIYSLLISQLVKITLSLEHCIIGLGLLGWRNGLAPHAHSRMRLVVFFLCIFMLHHLKRAPWSFFKILKIIFILNVAIFKSNSCLVHLLIFQCQLFLLGLLLVEFTICLDDVILGELTQDLELIQQLSLAIHQNPLLFKLLA